jgi:hypothetical protein
MKLSLVSYKTASWSLLIIGFGHTLTYLTAPNTPEQNILITTMKALNFNMLGVDANIFSFYEGFSLMMGLLLIGYGLINILTLKNNKQSYLPTNMLILNIIISFFSVAISLKYFFLIPVVFTSIPFIGYLISLSTRKMKTKRI